jgi:hypothetical protein
VAEIGLLNLIILQVQNDDVKVMVLVWVEREELCLIGIAEWSKAKETWVWAGILLVSW